MLNRRTPLEQQSLQLGDAVRMSYAGVGKTRQQYANEVGAPLEAVTTVVKGEAHTLDRAMVQKIAGGIRATGEEAVRLSDLVAEVTPRGYRSGMN